MKALILYDGTMHSKNALKYGIDRLRKEGGRATIIHVFNDALFIGYGAGPNAEARARAESQARLEEAREIIRESGSGLWLRLVSEDGDPEEVALHYAAEENINVILAPARCKRLYNEAPYPVIFFPGTILVPVDNTCAPEEAISHIVSEALSSGSDVIIMGTLPVHMYAPSERDELKAVERGTGAAIRRLKGALESHGLKVRTITRSGYPDEEILKAMREFSASMVIVPASFEEPSELSKAVQMILDETENKKRLISLAVAPAGK